MDRYNIYLGGSNLKEWRQTFLKEIDNRLSVYNSMRDDYSKLSKNEKEEQTAKEFHLIKECDIIVFYFDSKWEGITSLLELGESVGLNKQVIVGADDSIEHKEKLAKYCEYRGILFADNAIELAQLAKDCFLQTKIVQSNNLNLVEQNAI